VRYAARASCTKPESRAGLQWRRDRCKSIVDSYQDFLSEHRCGRSCSARSRRQHSRPAHSVGVTRRARSFAGVDQTTTPSTMAQRRSTCRQKSLCPGCPRCLIFVSWRTSAVFFASMGMPRSRSRSSKSSTALKRGTRWRGKIPTLPQHGSTSGSAVVHVCKIGDGFEYCVTHNFCLVVASPSPLKTKKC